MEWNSLPHSLRDPTRSTDSLRSALKTHLFAAISALDALRDALYKSTITTTTITTTTAIIEAHYGIGWRQRCSFRCRRRRGRLHLDSERSRLHTRRPQTHIARSEQPSTLSTKHRHHLRTESQIVVPTPQVKWRGTCPSPQLLEMAGHEGINSKNMKRTELYVLG